MFSLFVQLVWKAVENCYGLWNHLLGEHVGFHRQVWWQFWLGWIHCRQWCSSPFFIQAVSSWSNKPVVDIALPKFWRCEDFRAWKSRLVDTQRLKWNTDIKQPYPLTVFNLIEQPGHWIWSKFCILWFESVCNKEGVYVWRHIILLVSLTLKRGVWVAYILKQFDIMLDGAFWN